MTPLRTLLLVLLLAPAALAAQGVLVAPTGIFIDPRTRGASVEIYNPGSDPVEVSITTAFGYPVSDSLGQVTLHIDETPDSMAPSAAAWVEAFPRRLILRPAERRTVRLLAHPPAGLPDGDYWARLIVDAKGGQVALRSPSESAGIRVGLDLDVRTIVAVFYRQGRVRTGVAMTGARARAVHDSVEVCAHFTREGNAAFLGALHAALSDSVGRPISSLRAPLAVYYALSPCLKMRAPALRPGRYIVHLLVDTDRDDLPRDALLPITAVRDSVALTVPHAQ